MKPKLDNSNLSRSTSRISMQEEAILSTIDTDEVVAFLQALLV
jgi:hypothetical protein